jgi:hypothetical protein
MAATVLEDKLCLLATRSEMVTSAGSKMGPHKRGKWGRRKERGTHAHTVMKASTQPKSI